MNDFFNFSEIDNVFFDLGSVLINLDKNRCIQSFSKLGIKNIENLIENSFKKGMFYQIEKGEISSEIFRDEIRKFSDTNLKDEEIDAAWNDFLLDIPEKTLKLLQFLQKKRRIFLLSNTNKIHFDFIDEKYLLSRYFELCFLSYELKEAKPDDGIFEKVLKLSKVDPERSLFIDDNLQNLQTADKFGFKTYHTVKNISEDSIFDRFMCL